MSHDAEIAVALSRLNDLILARNRSSGRSYTLVLIPHSQDEELVQTLDGKPIPTDISPFVALNAAVIERYGSDPAETSGDESLHQERLAWMSLNSSWGLFHDDPERFRPYVELSLKNLREMGVPEHYIKAMTPYPPKLEPKKDDASNLPPMSNKVEGGGHFGLG